MKIKELFLKCQCSCSSLQIQKDPLGDKEYWVSIWLRGYDHKIYSFKERLRWCWHILKTGLPLADDVILTYESIEELKKFLNE